jgi:DNA-binding HxlR family transcriptional regulator
MEGYSQYCPLAKGAEVFAERWTPLILRELLRGSTTFNDLHRGVPRMSRSLLSSRLKKLEDCGVLERHLKSTGTGYKLTPAGRELGPVVTQLGAWAQRWYRSTFRGDELDVGVLMWDIRCTVHAKALAAVRTVVQFMFSDLRANSGLTTCGGALTAGCGSVPTPRLLMHVVLHYECSVSGAICCHPEAAGRRRPLRVGRDLPDAAASWILDRELALSAMMRH